MSLRTFHVCFLSIAVFGLVNGSWWQDQLNAGSHHWRRSSRDKRSEKQGSGSSDGDCECVPDFQCDGTGEIITDGVGIVGNRVSRNCAEDEVCCRIPPEVTDPSPVRSSFVCGFGTQSEDMMKVSGDLDDTETRPGYFPWTLILNYVLGDDSDDEERPQVLLCGASLIFPSVALTAAHCLDHKKPENIIVRAGEWDLASDDDDGLPPQERRVARVEIHPKYDLYPIKNDIAVLFLDSPFEGSPTVNTICMPSSEEDVTWTRCYATGWGVRGDNGFPIGNQTLQKAKIPLVNDDECEKTLQETKLGRTFKLHKSFLCAGGESDIDTCKGDGGGPLACQSSSPPYSFHLVGITSWGVGCGHKGIPGVYTNVTVLSDWVATTIEQVQSVVIPKSSGGT